MYPKEAFISPIKSEVSTMKNAIIIFQRIMMKVLTTTSMSKIIVWN